MESVLVEVDPTPAGAAAVLARLRAGEPPVVARAERGRVVLDLRTVPPEQDEVVARALAAALGPPAGPAGPTAPSGP
jgi:L-seryl-tRNA(Ser) seleniumtransferase